jgi:hypothetical protein
VNVREEDIMGSDSHDSVTKKHQPGHPENVGKSVAGRGEDVVTKHGKEPGRYEVQEAGSDRPVGKSTPRDRTGVAPEKPKS